MRSVRRALVAAVVTMATVGVGVAVYADGDVGALLGAKAAASAGSVSLVSAPRATTTPTSSPSTPPATPLAGTTIVVDPGHQLGNSRFPREINRLVDDGAGGQKACNTTGTATNGGFPEATFAWRVGYRLRDKLKALGAKVIMTRTTNSVDKWGPCVDVRGKMGNRGYQGLDHRADLKVSIHGDGSSSGNHGYHVIVVSGSGTEHDKSLAFGKAVRATLDAAGFTRSTYIGGGTALSIRGDLATLNWSKMPAVMVELGNMRNSGDASVMTSARGQTRYADALLAGIERYLGVTG